MMKAGEARRPASAAAVEARRLRPAEEEVKLLPPLRSLSPLSLHSRPSIDATAAEASTPGGARRQPRAQRRRTPPQTQLPQLHSTRTHHSLT